MVREDVLQDLHEAGRADLAIVGTEGRSGLSRILGSVAERLLDVLPMDVLTVRRHRG